MNAHDATAGTRKRPASLILFTLLVLAGALPVGSASADEPGETTVGYVLVQQALGHLAHDSSEEGVMVAMEKVDDALSTENQEGVDVAQLEQAQTLLESGQVLGARALLQSSIAQALSEIEPAVGEETGTTEVLSPLPGRGELTGQDWILLLASVLLLLTGAVLSWIFRPQDKVRELRQRLATPQGVLDTPVASTTEESP
jgi:hypothetical protein